MDAHTMYLDNLGGCNDDGYFEDDDTDARECGSSDKPVPTANPNGIGPSILADAQFDACMDRLHLTLAAHFSALGVTAISQIQERR